MPLNLKGMAIWQTPLFPYAIEFDSEKMDELRIAVIDGFYAVPHGGVEIGGVLYGTRENKKIRVEDYRKVETEYLSGPSFHLSENDLDGLRKMLAEPAPVGSNGVMEIVGWYHSHTRSTIHLSTKDLEIFEEFFPRAWQIALVLSPENLGPVRGGYFFRDERGTIAAEASANEFALQPTLGEKAVKKEMRVGHVETSRPRLAKTRSMAAQMESRNEGKAPPMEAVIAAPTLYISEPMRLFGLQPWVIGLVILILLTAASSGYWIALQK
jgi:proteasome lid subunit RPN8/RPN11